MILVIFGSISTTVDYIHQEIHYPHKVWKLFNMTLMNSTKTCPSVTFYFMKNSFSDINRKWILPNMIRARATLIIFGKMHFLLISENEIFIVSLYRMLRNDKCQDFMNGLLRY